METVENILEIKRFEHDTDQANRSVQLYNGHFIGFGLERPNLNNKPFVSRINAGTYYANKVNSEKRGEFWLLEDVPRRTEIILNHTCNTVEDVAGCTGLGLELDRWADDNNELTRRAISDSKFACEQFMEMTKDETRLKVIIT